MGNGSTCATHSLPRLVVLSAPHLSNLAGLDTYNLNMTADSQEPSPMENGEKGEKGEKSPWDDKTRQKFEKCVLLNCRLELGYHQHRS